MLASSHNISGVIQYKTEPVFGADSAVMDNWTSIRGNNLTLDDHGGDNTIWARPALLKQSLPMVVVLCVAYTTVFVLGVVNNSLVVSVIYQNPQMRTVTNYFIANLAVADILVSFVVLPITLLSNLFTEWLFGPFLCKAIPYLQAVVVGASVNTLAAVAVERYFAIFHSQSTIINANVALVVISIMWLIPVCIQTPFALFYTEETFEHKGLLYTLCYFNSPSETFKRGFYLGVVFLSCYLIPLCFITVFYTLIGIKVWKRNVAGIRGSKAERNIQQSKIRIVRMLVTVAVVFAVSWLPLYSLRMRTMFGPTMAGTEKQVVDEILQPLAQWLGAANSCVNPFIYCYFSEYFRKSIETVLRKACWGGQTTRVNV